MSDPVIWEITMPGMPTKQFIPLAFYKQLEAENARLQAEVERLRSLSANSEWQPIETAPKDGQDILAYRHPHGAFLIPYYWGNDTYQMTHWMPLPKPPAAKEGKPSV